MLSGGPSVSLVRVYSETVEYKDFPMPGHVTAYKTRARLADSIRDERLKSISLHHLVREGDSPASQFIRNMDQLIRSCLSRHRDNDAGSGDDGFPSSEDLDLYRTAIKERELELLMTADVILCTCVAAAANRITSSTNILQVQAITTAQKLRHSHITLKLFIVVKVRNFKVYYGDSSTE